MKIFQVHNKYQLSGGEDGVFNNEKDLLESNGDTVIQYQKDNKEIENFSLLEKASLLFKTSWNQDSYLEIKDKLKEIKPDICHVHNYLPLLSPSIFYACNELKIPVIQTLHNYRLLCASAYLFRDGHICEECIGKSTYRSLKYNCYRDSKIQSFAVSRMIETHKNKKTWQNIIDGFICLTEFSKSKFVEGGISTEKLFLKPNFLSDDPGFSQSNQNYFLFVGRLDETKGIHILLDAMKKLPHIKFKIAGDGPLKAKLNNYDNLEYLGQLDRANLFSALKNCISLIFPSMWYENMPLSIIEAFACGKPVIASDLGAMAELIKNEKTGLLFEPGNSEQLAQKIDWAFNYPEEIRKYGINAREEYEKNYTAKKNYEILISIYNQILFLKSNPINI